VRASTQTLAGIIPSGLSATNFNSSLFSEVISELQVFALAHEYVVSWLTFATWLIVVDKLLALTHKRCGCLVALLTRIRYQGSYLIDRKSSGADKNCHDHE
jgi:hypothetical protein